MANHGTYHVIVPIAANYWINQPMTVICTMCVIGLSGFPLKFVLLFHSSTCSNILIIYRLSRGADNFIQPIGSDMDIDLGGLAAPVPEQGLDVAQVRALLQ
jgi:hypothetical protein